MLSRSTGGFEARPAFTRPGQVEPARGTPFDSGQPTNSLDEIMAKELEPFCFWCGGNAQFEFCTQPRPFYAEKLQLCDSCSALQGSHIIVFELIEGTDPGCGNPMLPALGVPVYYSGRWRLIDDHQAAQAFPPDRLPGVLQTRIAGLRADNYARAGFDKYPWRTIQ